MAKVELTYTQALTLSAVIQDCNTRAGLCLVCGQAEGHAEACAVYALTDGVSNARTFTVSAAQRNGNSPERDEHRTRRGRPARAERKGKRGGDNLTAAGRKRLSDAMKARHAERKRKERTDARKRSARKVAPRKVTARKRTKPAVKRAHTKPAPVEVQQAS